ncbi:unnamed protein product [Lathyrus oleraceus]
MDQFNKFSNSTGLKINPIKCNIYFGVMDEKTSEDIKNATRFKEGKLPFRYLGVPLTSKRLSIHHYDCLIDKIVGRITRWSSRLLSYAGRIQLIQSVNFATMTLWM